MIRYDLLAVAILSASVMGAALAIGRWLVAGRGRVRATTPVSGGILLCLALPALLPDAVRVMLLVTAVALIGAYPVQVAIADWLARRRAWHAPAIAHHVDTILDEAGTVEAHYDFLDYRFGDPPRGGARAYRDMPGRVSVSGSPNDADIAYLKARYREIARAGADGDHVIWRADDR